MKNFQQSQAQERKIMWRFLEFCKAGEWKNGGTDIFYAVLGYPYYSSHDDLSYHPYYNDDCPPMRGMYRFHIPDPIYFEKRYPYNDTADWNVP